MRNLYKTLCAVLAAALLALTLLPAGVLAAGADLEISVQNFPDANFRAWLTNPANLNGAGVDGSLSAEELAAVTKLDLSGQNIADLTGIEHFTALESLNVSNNRLTTLDMRANTRLRYLYCATNFLTSLDVTRCAELIDLNCERNQLTALDLSGNPKLQQLYCRHNFLSALDVSHNLELVFIETFDNQLTQFDASMLKKLRFLHIDYNRLTELDMSHNPVLEGNGFVAANNSLNRLTAHQQNVIAEVTQKYNVASQQITDLSQAKEELDKKVTLASQLDATNITVERLNKRGRKTKRVKNIVKLKIDFTLAKNITAQTGDRTLYVRIIKPDNSILAKSIDNTFPYENRELVYSIKKYVEYNGEEQAVTVYWDVEEFLFAGDYHLDIFTDGVLIGSADFTLD